MFRKAKDLIIHLPFYYVLLIIYLLAFVVRVYRANDLMGFYYDQGRDALVIWNLWHEGKLFLIGPVTGLSGIFLGPFYYYLIAPFYLVGGGNPVYPAYFLALLSVIALYVLYKLGSQMHSKAAGLIASIIGGFSYYIVLTSRWLSNPNPILLTSVLFLYSLWKIVQKDNKRWWIGVFMLSGISLHFESASAVFYLPMVVIFAIWQRKQLPEKKIFMISLLLFLATFIPQIIFNFRHENILFENFKNLFFKEKAFRGLTKYIIDKRIDFFWSVFHTKLFTEFPIRSFVFTSFSFSALFVRRKHLKIDAIKLLLLFIITPLVFYTFFQGNYGNLYDYYLSGYYLPFILLFSIGLSELFKTKLGKIVVIIFFWLFLSINTKQIYRYLTATESERPIALEDQRNAISWIFKDTMGEKFNVDVYVPPVISYSWDYLFLWMGTKECGESLCGLVYDEQVSKLYTVYEVDLDHPERLDAWLERQKGIGEILNETDFGGVVVQERKRI